MGTVVGTVNDCREMFEGSAQTRITPLSFLNQTGNPVAYKLVRVAQDGRFVPATEEEIMEVNETDVHITSDACQTVGYLPAEVLPSKLSQLKSSEGLLKSDNVESYTDQYKEETLQNVEQEERLDTIHGYQLPSTPPDANIHCINENNLIDEDQVHHETMLQELIPSSSDVQNGCNMNHSNKIELCTDAGAYPKETALSAAAQRPDFSIARGEICLENLPIKALQEKFRATFGRETTVKDKRWLKRRIAMGLINSCDISTTNLTIKDKNLVGNQEKSNDVTDVLRENMGDDVRATYVKDAPSSTYHVNGHVNASGHSLSSNHYGANEEFSCEQRAAKRVRKPTRRYIEEISETDEKQHNDMSMIPSKDRRLSQKPEIRSIGVSSGKRVAVTRMVSLAGSEVEVPYVSHVRRSRPRENIMALMFDQDIEPEHTDSSGSSSDDNSNIGVPIMQGGALRRKHHRAWTLSEVTKLLEGISKYGAGKWSEIRKLSFSSYSYRTSVDLKDKWRNLLKASFAQSPSNGMGSFKKHGSMHIPMQILSQVRELAEKQCLVPPVRKVAGESNRREKETRSNFL